VDNITWFPIIGRAEITRNLIKYIPEVYVNPVTQLEENTITILGSSTFFENGEISFVLNLKEINAKAELIFNDKTVFPSIHVGINTGGAFGIAKYKESKWEFPDMGGDSRNLAVNKDYVVKVTIDGSRINLYIDEVLVASANEIIKKSQLKVLMRSDQEIVVRDFKVHSVKPKVFVVMQFSDEFNQLYSEVIKPVTETFGYECIRADEFFTTGMILEDIISSIKGASIIIADITPNNPNVFYEVGYAHAINKPTILLCGKTRDKLPFDVSSFRTLFYENTIAGKSAVEVKLKKYLESIG